MLQIANSFGGLTHRKTLVFVSTDASTAGAQGIRWGGSITAIRPAPVDGVPGVFHEKCLST